MKDYSFRAAPFKMYGMANYEKNGVLERVPRSLREEIPNIEFFGRRIPGARLAFRTDSPRFEITIHMESAGPDYGMAIFACQSASVYVGSHTKPRYLGLAFIQSYERPIAKATFTKDPVMEDVLIFMPRNEVITDIMISVEDGAVLEPPTPYKYPKPVVYYGSSITEGGHSSNPGNVYNALLSRWLDVDYLNLGFSGSAQGETAMADFINTLDMCAFVYDYDHNAPSVEHLAQTHEPFYRRIREVHPDLPILMLSRPDADYRDAVPRLEVIRRTYENALKAGDKNVWFIDGGTFYGTEDRDVCSGDTTHPNDLGMYRMAQTIRPVLQEMLDKVYGKDYPAPTRV